MLRFLLLASCLLSGCCNTPAEPPPPAPTPTATASVDLPPRLPAPSRIVAIGDLHGDLQATRAALKLAGAIDDKDHWSGGPLVLVQTGDQIDRGDDDREILELFDRLREEAVAAGGKAISLLGNHEIINSQLRFDYVTAGGFKGFANVPSLSLDDPHLSRVPEFAKPRAAALKPGGPYAVRLSARDAVAIVGDTLFVHGGVLPKHLHYGLPRINRELRSWLAGQSPPPPDLVLGEDGPLWARRYSASTDKEDCKVLNKVLTQTQTKRMVVGHTVQRGGISSACDEKVWRIDVGLSRYYQGSTEVLEISGDSVRPIKPR